MKRSSASIGRRAVLKGMTAGVAAATIARPAFAVPRTLKLGLVAPQTGPLTLFSEEIPFVLNQIKKTFNGQIKINGTNHPFEIIVKDSQSNPNRASEVALDLILKNKIDIMCAFATPETVNPVADQCELNGIPCISNDAPLDSYFFGRHGDPKKGFEWTYNFFFSGSQVIRTYMGVWHKVKTNNVLGVLWANDDDGNTFAKVMPPVIEKGGFKIIDPGRFDMPLSNYSAQISAFKSAGVELVFSVIPGPEFTTFWNGAAQQGFRPKVMSPGKVAEFPQGVNPYGNRAVNLSIEVWWSRFHPFSSGMTGQTSAELADDYEKTTKREYSMALGFRHSLFEVAFDVLKRAQNLDKRASVRDALRQTNYKSVIGPVDFTKPGPFPNTCTTPLVGGQWRKGKKWPLELVIVDNTVSPEIPTNGEAEPIAYGS